MRRRRPLLLAVAASVTLAGLTGCSPEQASIDCPVALRIGPVVYDSVTLTSQRPRGGATSADESACDDEGSGAVGPHFPEQPAVVAARFFEEYGESVLGVRVDSGSYRGAWQVFVADDLVGEERDRIATALGRAVPQSRPR